MSVERTSEASYRAPLAVALSVAIAMGISLLPLVPGVARVLGVAWYDVALAMGLVSSLMMLGAILYRVAPTSAVYRRFDFIETIGIQLALMYLIFTSGRADSFFWIAILAHEMFVAHSTLNARYNRAFFIVLPLLLTVAFLVIHRDVPAAATTVVIGGLGLFIFQQVFSVSRKLEVADTERARLAAELADTRVREDRERIARDIHDGIGADLAALDWRLRGLRDGSSPELASEIDVLAGRLAQGTDDLRSIVWALRTPERTWTELVTYVRQRGAELCGSSIAFTLDASDDGGVSSRPGELALDYLRAVLELVRNAVRHASATRIEVSLTSTRASIVARVSDNGTGLQPDILARTEGGLANLRRRVARTGGALTVTGQQVELSMGSDPVDVRPADSAADSARR
jgi:signal transduction histidine kinase